MKNRPRQLFRAPGILLNLLASAGFFAVGAPAATTFKTIHTFNSAVEGNTPDDSLVQGGDGLLYGTASAGGVYNNGTCFRLTTDGTSFYLLQNFPGTNAGVYPAAGLVQARDGNFYGTTYRGGSSGVGTLFSLTPTGTLNYITSFIDASTPGASPVGALVEARDGTLHGTAEYGGSNNYGTIYSFTPPGGQPATTGYVVGGTDGTYPRCDLCLASDGNIYGTMTGGGASNYGIFFRAEAAGGYTVLYQFTGNTDGGVPIRGVVQGTDGAFYGVCNTGGAYGAGTVFRLAVHGSTVNFSQLHQFDPAAGDGSTPVGQLVAASDGYLYGTTTTGGSTSNGTIFRVTPSGGYDLVYNFSGGSDASDPIGGLIQGSDGKLYGTTAPTNGANSTVFQFDLGLATPTPAPQVLLPETASIGAAILIQGKNFVGATAVTFAGANGTSVNATNFTVISGTIISVVVPAGAVSGTVRVSLGSNTGTSPDSLTISYTRPAFFNGQVALSNGVYYLQFSNGNLFGYYAYLSDPNYIFHFDLGYEYLIDADDGAGGLYLYDFASSTFFYSSPSYPFPYLYDFTLGHVLYYFPDTQNAGHYTSNPRYFFDFTTGQVITK